MAEQVGLRYVDVIIGVVILTAVLASLSPTLVTSLNNLSTTLAANGVPFASLLSVSGITGILFGIGVFYTLYRIFMSMGRGAGGRKF